MESTESLASAVREYRDLTHDPANKAADALHLLGLIERHGWSINPATETFVVFQGPHGDLSQHSAGWSVESDGCNDENAHLAPTLIEALTEAANCKLCTGRN